MAFSIQITWGMTEECVFLLSTPDNTDVDRGQGLSSVKQCLHGLLQYWSSECFYPALQLSEVVASSKHPKKLDSREASWNVRKGSEPSHKFRV